MAIFIAPYPHRVRRAARWNYDDEIQRSMESEIFFPVDVIAGQDEFVLTALLPGVKNEDLDIQIVNETVSIQGKLADHRDPEASYLLQERPSGHFSRVLTLPAELDASKAEASLEDGVLTLHGPKAEAAKPKVIKVNTHA